MGRHVVRKKHWSATAVPLDLNSPFSNQGALQNCCVRGSFDFDSTFHGRQRCVIVGVPRLHGTLLQDNTRHIWGLRDASRRTSMCSIAKYRSSWT